MPPAVQSPARPGTISPTTSAARTTAIRPRRSPQTTAAAIIGASTTAEVSNPLNRYRLPGTKFGSPGRISTVS